MLRNEDGEEVREVLLEVEDIHHALLERNRKHFHQSDDTPFVGGAENMVLYDLLGYTGMSKAARDVVDGTFLEKYGDDLGNILPETEQVIKELAMPEEIKVLVRRLTAKSQRKTFSWESRAGKKVHPLLHQVNILDTTR